MRRNTVFVLALCLLALLCACGGAETKAPAPTATQAPSAAEKATPAPQPEKTPAPATTPAPPPADAPSEPPAPVNEALETAKSFIGKTTDELFAAIGAPESSDYAPSCLGPGEDGNLYYEGFTVYTYREDGVDTVRIVE